MRHIKLNALKTTLLCVSGLGLFTANSPAYAGGCGLGVNPALCQTGVNVNPGTGPVFDNMNVNVHQPMGFLRSVDYQRAPNVSITRVHGLTDSAGLSDFPSAFSNGCHPTSTAYCREDKGVPVNVQFNTPQVQAAPTFNFAPAYNFAPTLAPRIVATGGGYDPSKFIPRQYGEFSFTPGTAYIPTSRVNRNPADAARVLAENGYSTDAYPTGNYSAGNINLSAPLASSNVSFAAAAPNFNTLAGGPAPLYGAQTGQVPQGASYLGSVVTGQTTTGGASTPSGNAITGVDGSGGYWEQVSGLTRFGDTIATSVVCRRQAPQTTAQVVSPVYGVPQAVPTPVPYYVDVPYKVRGNVIPQGCRPAGPAVRGPIYQPRPIPGVLPYGPTMGGAFGVAPTVGQMAGWTY